MQDTIIKIAYLKVIKVLGISVAIKSKPIITHFTCLSNVYINKYMSSFIQIVNP